MKDLIEALIILAKYQKADTYAPTHCEHDVLFVVGVEKDAVPLDEVTRLIELGFLWSEENGGDWISFRFGSA